MFVFAVFIAFVHSHTSFTLLISLLKARKVKLLVRLASLSKTRRQGRDKTSESRPFCTEVNKRPITNLNH